MHSECLLLIKACLATGTIVHEKNEVLESGAILSAVALDSSAGTTTNLRALEMLTLELFLLY
jgi:hypothetical protein